MEILYFDDETLKNLTKELLGSLIQFIREVWDKNETVESYLAKRKIEFQENPFMKKNGFPLALLIENDRVIGHCNSMPCKVWANGKEWAMFWNAGLHLLPECRGRRLGKLLPEELTKQLPIISAFFVVPQQLKIHQKLGFHIVGKIPDFIKIYNPKKFFQEIDLSDIKQMPKFLKKITKSRNKKYRPPFSFLFSMMVGFNNLFRKYLVPKSSEKITFKIVDNFDYRTDLLWEKIKHSLKFSQVRNAKYMNWQFKPEKGWKKIIFEKNEEVLGFSIAAIRQNNKNDKLANMKMVSIIDLVWDFEKPYIINEFIRFMDVYAKEQNADLLFCSINVMDAINILKKNGFFKIPSTVYFVVHSSLKEVEWPGNLDDWFLTRGDADAAGSLGPKNYSG